MVVHDLDRYGALIAAIATGFIAWFTLTLKRSTDKLWTESRLQREQAKVVADRQFETTQESIRLARNSTHRPRIILREAIIGSVLEGEPISVNFHLANIGETTGTIIRSMVKVEVVPEMQRLLLHGSVEPRRELGEITLSPGMAILLKFEGDTLKWNAGMFLQKSQMVIGDPSVRLYYSHTIHFFGQFIYKDQAGIWRRCAFRRRLIPERQRFYRIPDEPDLDYSD